MHTQAASTCTGASSRIPVLSLLILFFSGFSGSHRLSGPFVHGTSVLDGHLKFFSILLDAPFSLNCRRGGSVGFSHQGQTSSLNALFLFFFLSVPHLCGHRLYLVIVVAGLGSSAFLLRRVVA